MHHVNSHVSLHYNPPRCQLGLRTCTRTTASTFPVGTTGGRRGRPHLPARHFAYFLAVCVLHCSDWCKMTLRATASGLFRFHQLMAAAVRSHLIRTVIAASFHPTTPPCLPPDQPLLNAPCAIPHVCQKRMVGAVQSNSAAFL